MFSAVFNKLILQRLTFINCHCTWFCFRIWPKTVSWKTASVVCSQSIYTCLALRHNPVLCFIFLLRWGDLRLWWQWIRWHVWGWRWSRRWRRETQETKRYESPLIVPVSWLGNISQRGLLERWCRPWFWLLPTGTASNNRLHNLERFVVFLSLSSLMLFYCETSRRYIFIQDYL